MQFVAWQHVSNWQCISCGECCRLYSVVISFHEWLKIVRNYGVEYTDPGLDKLFIRRDSDGSCSFLQRCVDTPMCGLQYMKPKACKLWPFKILAEPKFGDARAAVYSFAGNTFYVYADSMCRGLRYGMPRWDFVNGVLREFVEIALDFRGNQYKTTASISSGSRNLF